MQFKDSHIVGDTAVVHIGKAIAWGRRSIGLTQTQFANQIGCDRSWVYRLENGTSCPSHDFVEASSRMFSFRNVEEMKCGVLPERLSSLSQAQKASIIKRLSKLPNIENEIELATAGVRKPSDEVLTRLAKILSNGSVEDLLYGEFRTAVERQSKSA